MSGQLPSLRPIVAQTVIDLLFSQRPAFHGEADAGTANYSITREVCDWIGANVAEGSRTLETGCGYSTVSFLCRSGAHSVYSPFAGEHELIQRWCRTQGIPTDHVTFVAQPSQQALPSRRRERLDVVLIDGDHAFPAPFIDWYYLADDVAEGGILMVDDTHLTTGRILRDFLIAERTRWKLERELGKTAIFRRICCESVAQSIPWNCQPFVKDLQQNPPTLSGKIMRSCRRFSGVILPKSIKKFLRPMLSRY